MCQDAFKRLKRNYQNFALHVARLHVARLQHVEQATVDGNKTLTSGCWNKSKQMYSNVFIIFELSAARQ